MADPGLVDIREERSDDIAAIHDVVARSCGPKEADLVDVLRERGAALLSLVATLDGRVVGHILYSPASVGGVTGAALGPMGVVQEHQRQGIGGMLVQAGSRLLAEKSCPFIVVLGHAHFYPRFGFEPASRRGITCVWDVPDDVFMVQVLDGNRMQAVSGLATYRDEFSGFA